MESTKDTCDMELTRHMRYGVDKRHTRYGVDKRHMRYGVDKSTFALYIGIFESRMKIKDLVCFKKKHNFCVN